MNTNKKIIQVKVTPKSKKPRVEKVKEDFYKVFVKAPPEKGKANQEVLERLAVEFNTNISNLEIITGHTCKHKMIAINLDEKINETRS